MKTTTLTRQQLYDRVWSKPVDQLAKEFGISNVGLGKACRRHGIPVPPRGYWAKKAAGHRVRQVPLLAATQPWQERVTFHGSPRDESQEADAIEVHPLIAFEQAPEHQLVVVPDVEVTHPAVLKTGRLLRRAKRDANEMVPPPPGALRIHTSRALHERALRLWHVMLMAFEARGYAVAIGEQATTVTVLEEPIALSLHEGTKNVAHKITFTEQKEIDRGYGSRVPKWDHVPSEHITLAITNVSRVRHHWHDGPRPLETQLNKVMVGLVRAALEIKRQREEAERQEKVRQEEARRRLEAERRWAIEKGRRDRLHRFVVAWESAKSVQAFVDEYRAAIGQVAPDGVLATWLEWLGRRAVAIDPVRRLSPGRILTLYHPAYSFNADKILEEGFSDTEAGSWSEKDHPPGVFLTDGQPSGYYTTLIEVRIAEDVVLPYEWPDEASAARNFYVPAEIVNASRLRESEREPSPLPADV
jgi:hypothetical protein